MKLLTIKELEELWFETMHEATLDLAKAVVEEVNEIIESNS